MTKIIFILFSIFFIFGCSSKQKNSFWIAPYHLENSTIKPNNNLKIKLITVNASKKYGLPSSEEFIEFALKSIAKTTIKNGKKYFFIISPREVSNYEGRVINTIAGFKENINFVRSTNKFQCPKKISCPNLEIKIVFAMLDKKSMDYVVWDAKKILAN